MALKRPYRMHRRGTLQRAPGLTPIDSPAGAEPSSFDPDELTGKLGVQQEEEQEEQEEEQEEEVGGTHIGGGRSDKSPGQPQSRPERSRAAETPDPGASGASPAGRGSRRP
jgi:hypothetical protein